MNLRPLQLGLCLIIAVMLGCSTTTMPVQESPSATQTPLVSSADTRIASLVTPVDIPPSPISVIDADAPAPCPVTIPNGSTPPYQNPGPLHHGNGALWTILGDDGKYLASPSFVLPDGSIRLRLLWWTTVKDQLTIQGRKLDAPAPPLWADIPTNKWGGFFATSIFFPSEGCWEVIGKVGNESLTFVTIVIKVGT